jgi:L-fuconolactonase
MTGRITAHLTSGVDKMTERADQSKTPAEIQTEIVDAQCSTSAIWFLPVESLVGEMDRTGVRRAVLVQLEGEFDNDYQFNAVRRHPGRFANVVALDYGRPDASSTLAALAHRGACGVRLPATARSPGNDPLAIWKAVGDLKLSISCSGNAAEYFSADFANLLAAIPTVPVVLEHSGGAYGYRAPIDDLKKVYALARFQNVYVKFGGMSEFCTRAVPVAESFPFVRPIPPVLDMIYDTFGPDRMMWGSDYPPVAGREGYRNALHYPMDQLMAKSDEDRAWIFGRTAAKVFPVLT